MQGKVLVGIHVGYDPNVRKNVMVSLLMYVENVKVYSRKLGEGPGYDECSRKEAVKESDLYKDSTLEPFDADAYLEARWFEARTSFNGRKGYDKDIDEIYGHSLDATEAQAESELMDELEVDGYAPTSAHAVGEIAKLRKHFVDRRKGVVESSVAVTVLPPHKPTMFSGTLTVENLIEILEKRDAERAVKEAALAKESGKITLEEVARLIEEKTRMLQAGNERGLPVAPEQNREPLIQENSQESNTQAYRLGSENECVKESADQAEKKKKSRNKKKKASSLTLQEPVAPSTSVDSPPFQEQNTITTLTKKVEQPPKVASVTLPVSEEIARGILLRDDLTPRQKLAYFQKDTDSLSSMGIITRLATVVAKYPGISST